MDGPSLSPDSAVTAPPVASPWKRRLLVWVLPLLVAGGGLWYYGSAGRFVETDNAYVHRDRIDVAPQVSGDIVQVLVAENAPVAAGQPVLKLDDTLARIAVDAAEARLNSARADIESLKATWREKVGQAAVGARAAELSQRELERQRQLAEQRLVPASQLDSVQRSTDIASGAAAVMRLQAEQSAAKLGGSATRPNRRH